MMQRRSFLKSTLAAGAGVSALSLQAAAEDAPQTATGSVFSGKAVVCGPAPDSLTILQPVHGPATGFLEIAVAGGPFQRIEAEAAGLLPYAQHVLKFRLPPVPGGVELRYRVTARPVDFQNAYKILPGEPEAIEPVAIRTLDPASASTRFHIWNDTHENLETLQLLHARTAEARPDFLVWNGDQTNDIYDETLMTGQFLAPGGLPIAAEWPLAYARGNHDVRGPAARKLAEFTGSPDDRYYCAFRSGPVAVLVMDTGEDKPDDHPVFGGLAAFEPMRRRQQAWLAETIQAAWFSEAPFKVLCCHIPLWWKDEVTDVGHWRFSRVCRDAWLPLLVEGGVQLVVSGHTHEPAWLPPGAERPIGQLIGGAPRPQQATLIEGVADDSRLTLTMRRLDGRALETVELTA
ncbi:MAG: metallophosphoesterase [Planctomyces sp.]|nr:metallophosphoesterase [Planctomyces sp.]